MRRLPMVTIAMREAPVVLDDDARLICAPPTPMRWTKVSHVESLKAIQAQFVGFVANVPTDKAPSVEVTVNVNTFGLRVNVHPGGRATFRTRLFVESAITKLPVASIANPVGAFNCAL